MENINVWELLLEMLTALVVGIVSIDCYIEMTEARVKQKFLCWALATVVSIFLFIYTIGKVLVLWQF